WWSSPSSIPSALVRSGSRGRVTSPGCPTKVAGALPRQIPSGRCFRKRAPIRRPGGLLSGHLLGRGRGGRAAFLAALGRELVEQQGLEVAGEIGDREGGAGGIAALVIGSPDQLERGLVGLRALHHLEE